MTTNQLSGGPAARTKSRLTSNVNGVTKSAGVVLLTTVAVYAFVKIATIALVIVGLELGRGSFG